MPSFILLPPQHFCGGTYSTNIIQPVHTRIIDLVCTGSFFVIRVIEMLLQRSRKMARIKSVIQNIRDKSRKKRESVFLSRTINQTVCDRHSQNCGVICVVKMLSNSTAVRNNESCQLITTYIKTLILCGFQTQRCIALCEVMEPFTPIFSPRNHDAP